MHGILLRFVFLIFLTSFTLEASHAQNTSGEALNPPQFQQVDENGVDLLNGVYRAQSPVLSAGSGETESRFVLTWTGKNWAPNFPSLSKDNDGHMFVTLNGATEEFDKRSDGFAHLQGYNGLSLTCSTIQGADWIDVCNYAGRDGTAVQFHGIPRSFGSFPENRKYDYQHYGNLATTPVLVTLPGVGTEYHFAGQDPAPNTIAFKEITTISNGGKIRARLLGGHIVETSGRQNQTTFTISMGGQNLIISTPNLSTSNAAHTYLRPNNVTQTMTDSLGRTYTYAFNSNGRLTSHNWPGGQVSILSYDSEGRVQTLSNQGRVSTYNYSTENGITRTIATNPAGGQTIVDYVKKKGWATRVQDPLGRVTTYAYDVKGRVTSTVMPEGNSKTFEYDARGNVWRVTETPKPGSTELAKITTAEYPASCSPSTQVVCNRPVRITDPKSIATELEYAANGKPSLVRRAAPSSGAARPTQRFSYQTVVGPSPYQAATVTSSTSECMTTENCVGTADEVVTEYQYASGSTRRYPVSKTTRLGNGTILSTETMTYDAADNLKSVDGPLPGAGDTVVYRYDVVRRRIGEVRPDPDGAGPRLPFATRTTYNANNQITLVETGNVIDSSDPAWSGFVSLQKAATAYDTFRRPIAVATSGVGATETYAETSYDVLDRPVCQTVRLNPSTFPSIGANGTLVGGSQLDACFLQPAGSFGADRMTKLHYNAAGEIIRTQMAVGTTQEADEETNTYTLNGKLATVKDGENNLTTFEYDGHDRLKTTRYPVPGLGSFQSSATDFEQLNYDANGNVTQRRLRDGQMHFMTYDNLNRLIARDVPNLAYYEWDKTFQYDLMGRQTQAADASGTINYIYDGLGRLTSESMSGLGAKTHLYDPAGRRTRLTHPDGFFVTYDYDTTGNVTAIREYGAGAGVGVLAIYNYDNLGRRTSIVRGNGTMTNYNYDGLSRLSALGQDMVGSASDVSATFAYNPASQISQYVRDNDNYRWQDHVNVNRTYGTNGLNQLTTAGSTLLGYDGRGNLTSSGNVGYTYTSENRLATGNGANLGYDAAGRLLFTSKNDLTYFEYDGTELIAERAGAGGPIINRYVHGPADDDPIVWYAGSGASDRRWLHADERGSIVAVTNGVDGNTVINAYDEYGLNGNSQSPTNSSTNTGRFQYTGQTWLPEVGMYYYKARIYSATLGRFLQTDPAGYKDGINWYDYVGGDPVNLDDPDGQTRRSTNRPRTPRLGEGASAANRLPKNFWVPAGYRGSFAGLTPLQVSIGQARMADQAGFTLGRNQPGFGYQAYQTNQLLGRPVGYLSSSRTSDHHIMPQAYRPFFASRGINIDSYTVTVPHATHMNGLHGRGLGNMPGRWNSEWARWITAHPNATPRDIFQQAGRMLDTYNINHLQIHPYRSGN